MNKEQQVLAGFREVLNKITWLNKFKMENSLRGYTSSEVHCIEYIGTNVDSNVTTLATSSYMTRGAISKMTKKLISKGVIESYQKADNKKEVYFRLTEEGQAVYSIHEELHNEFRERDKVVFEQIPDEHYNNMLRFIEIYTSHLDTEIKKQGIDINLNKFE